MAKMITRTVTTYKHTFGNIDTSTGTPQINVMGCGVYPNKLGPRTAKKVIESMGLPKDARVLYIDPIDETYAVSLEKFMEIAEKVEKEEKEDNN